MIQIILLLFGTVLLLIGWYFKRHITDLEIVFTTKNNKNLEHMAFSFIITGLVGIIIGFILPTKIVALFFVSIVLVISATYSILLSRYMK